MRKFILVSILTLISFYSVFAQETTYKIEMDLDLNGGLPGNYFASFSPSNSGLSLINVSFSGPGTRTVSIDEVRTFSSPVTEFSYVYNVPPTCGSGVSGTLPFSGSECSFINVNPNPRINCLFINPSNSSGNRFFPIESLSLLNPDFSNVIPDCERRALIVGGCDFRYRLVARVNGIESTILPYGRHSSSVNISIDDIPNLDIDELFEIQVHYTENPTDSEKSEWISSNFIACSPELIPSETVTTNASCFGENDGGITLTFDDNIDSSSQMRYYIYERPMGATSPTDAFTGDPDTVFPPQAIADLRLGSLVDNNDGTYSGSSITGDILEGDGSLGAGEYYILYQEIDFNTTPITVKSGKLTPDFFTIEQPTEIQITNVDITEPECTVTATGSAEISVTGGTDFQNGTYEYSRDNGITWQTQNTFDTLSQGQSYDFKARLVFTNGGECIGPGTERRTISTITNVLSINNGTGISKQPTNSSSNDGEVFIRIDGGTPNFTFELYNTTAPTTPVQSSTVTTNPLNQHTFTNLDEGIYFVIVRDATCDITTQNFVLEAAPTPQLSNLVVTPISCFNANDATITVTATYPNATTFFYELREGATIVQDGNVPSTQNISISAVEPGDYELFVRASIGDFSSVDIPEIINPNPITVSITSVPFSCSDSTDGAITVVANGATNYEYRLSTDLFNWFPLTGNTIPVANPNLYEVTLRDRDNPSCISAVSNQIEVTRPTEISVVEVIANHQNVSVNGGNDGAIFIDVIGGTPDVLPNPEYSYSWTGTLDIDGSSYSNNRQNISNLSAGTYQVIVTDTNGCQATLSAPIIISEPGPLEIQSFTGTNVLCNGQNDGTLTVVIQGTLPVTYTWILLDGSPGGTIVGTDTNSTNTSVLNNVGPGEYQVSVQDANVGPSLSANTVTIEEPESITLSSVVTPLSAAGSADGAIDIAASGGTGDLNFSWVGPPGFIPTTDEDISGLIGGEYIVTVQDENGCSVIFDPIVINEPGAIIISLTINQEIFCNGDEFGEIIADVQGGEPDYTYEWFQEGNNTPLDETTNLITNLGAGNYFLRVTDAIDVSRDSDTIMLTEPNTLEVTLQNKVDIVCSGDASGIININVQGGTLPYKFQWSNGATSQNLANIEAGDYFVEVFDANGCFDLLEVTINPAPDALQLDATVTNVSEYLANDGSIALNITGGTDPYTINWTRDSDNSPAGNTATLATLVADSYTVVVSDVNGCNTSETFEVTQPDIVEATIVQPSCQGDSNGSISVLVDQGNGSFTYLWNTGETTNAITNLGAGDYTVTIIGFGNEPLTRTYTLIDPLPLEVDLGQNRVLCVDQVLELDATVDDNTATYSWTSDTGFSSSTPNVTLNTTGNYTVTVQTAAGCTAVDTLFLEVSTDEIDAEFAVSSQVFTGEVLVAVDISFPLPDTIEWAVPESADVVKQDSDEVELIFDEPGEYEITLITNRGGCIAQKTKKVLVVAKDGSVNEEDDLRKLVEDFIVYPNPTTGQFTADVSLTERGNISIKVFNFANNMMMASERASGDTSYSIPFDISGMPTGVYAVLLETPYGTSLRKVVVR